MVLRRKTTLTVAVLLFILSACVNTIEFKITWRPGKTEVLKYENSPISDCLYNSEDDVTKCMYIRKFKTIKDAWRYHPDTLQYISVRCQAQENYHSPRHVCICKDGSDAANPGQSQQHDKHYYCHIKQLTNRMFSKLSNLTALDLSDNLINNIAGDALDSVTSLMYLDLSRNPLRELSGSFLCDASTLRILLMENTHFTQFPTHIFDCKEPMVNLTYIDLSDNIMGSIPSRSFKNIPNVERLDLSSNNFSSFAINAFTGASALISLDLSENDLSVFPDGMCQSLPKLQYLFMAENRFKDFNVSVLSECVNLRYLNISVNNIGELKEQITSPSQVETLIFSRNRIKFISGSGFLSNARNLTELDLSLNMISEINSDAFGGLANLKTLNLSGNSLNESVNIGSILRPLTSLTKLDLSVNEFKVVMSGSFLGLTRLQQLSLSRNSIQRLEDKAFDGLGQLKVLDLRINSLTSLEPDVLNALKSLMLLDLSYNALLDLDNVKLPKSLIKVDAYNNRLAHFPNSFAHSKVQYINLKRNEIQDIFVTALQNITSVRHVDLSYNRLKNIAEGSFSSMTSLKALNLSHNELSLNLSKDIFLGLSSLTCLDLSFNRINKLQEIASFSSFANLEHLNLSRNSMTSVHDLLPNGVTMNNTKLMNLDLSNCGIEFIGKDVFDGFSGIKYVNMSHNKIRMFQPFQTQSRAVFNVLENPLACECNMKWLKTMPEKLRSYKLPKCIVYPLNKTRNVRDVLKGDFLCSQTDACPSVCRCYSSEPMGDIVTAECSSKLEVVPSTLPNTTVTLYLSGNNLTTLRFSTKEVAYFNTEVLYLNNSRIKYVESNFFTHFSKLKKLMLEHNDLTDIASDTFSPLLYLEELSLHHNRLVKLRADVIHDLKSLKMLDLRNNSMKYLEEDFLEEIDSLKYFKRIYLGENAWRCNCKNADFRKWIDSKKFIIYDRNNIKCGKSMMRYVDEDRFVCETETSVSHLDRKSLIISCVVVIVVFAILLTALLYYRRDILAALYTRFRWGCFRPGYTDGKMYDVFLMYDNNDAKSSEWVEDHLLPRLQRNQSYRVIIPNPANPRASDEEEELKQIYDCKCGVFVLSKYVTSNQFCNDCFERASRLSKSQEDFNLILLVLGDIDMALLDPEMRKILTSGNYITIRSRSVWDRLFYELPNPRTTSGPFREEDEVSESDVIIYSPPSTRPSNDYGTVLIQ
ncbi:hypothetical protein FSP39_005467 [Pinctada imbricata]|uniref:TIR domain-containing protein n=1 Tax=Pinctada imbricata TaxID=66713 RepID=A0AA89BT33_PINIB|nr:hypothetical protein FSP39_005467 [Pinctada imbricata]